MIFVIMISYFPAAPLTHLPSPPPPWAPAQAAPRDGRPRWWRQTASPRPPLVLCPVVPPRRSAAPTSPWGPSSSSPHISSPDLGVETNDTVITSDGHLVIWSFGHSLKRKSVKSLIHQTVFKPFSLSWLFGSNINSFFFYQTRTKNQSSNTIYPSGQYRSLHPITHALTHSQWTISTNDS